jgi:hypothetical protein
MAQQEVALWTFTGCSSQGDRKQWAERQATFAKLTEAAATQMANKHMKRYTYYLGNAY